MSAQTKVDAMAELAELERWFYVDGYTNDMYRVRNVRKAVAELVEADLEYDAAREAMDKARNTSASTEAWNRLVKAQDRRAAALERFGG